MRHSWHLSGHGFSPSEPVSPSRYILFGIPWMLLLGQQQFRKHWVAAAGTLSGTEVELEPPLASSPVAAGSARPSSAPTRPAELTCETLNSSCDMRSHQVFVPASKGTCCLSTTPTKIS